MAGQDRGGNEGFSGTPYWKIKEQMAQYRSLAEEKALASVTEYVPAEPPNVLVDAVCLGGAADAGKKPYVRHVIVKDLNKIAGRLRIDFPKSQIFKNKAPVGLYAIFDGQSCAGAAGPGAAEFCARTFHTKVMENISKLPPDQANETFVKAALIKSFEDLDVDLLANQPDLMDGCGASVALLVGDHVFSAVLGQCSAVLCEVKDGKHTAQALGGGHGQLSNAEERSRLNRAGATVVGSGATSQVRHPSGALSPVSRSLGDRLWKGVAGGGVGGPLVVCAPDVQSVALKGMGTHPFILFAASSVSTVLGPQELVDIASGYTLQPRASSGDIAARALEAHGQASAAQCTAVQVTFLPPRHTEKSTASGPPAKKARTDASTQSRRLRHILLKFNDGTQPSKAADSKKPARTRQQAEASLRETLKDLTSELEKSVKTRGTPKDGNDIVMRQSKRFSEIAKELSDCDTSKKGGSMCGDLGWLSPEVLGKFGGNFKENTDILKPGQWSDITLSDQGLHLVQRIA